MKTQPSTKAGYDRDQHNETLVVQAAVKAGDMEVRSDTKAGSIQLVHDETLVVRSRVHEDDCDTTVCTNRNQSLR